MSRKARIHRRPGEFPRAAVFVRVPRILKTSHKQRIREEIRLWKT